MTEWRPVNQEWNAAETAPQDGDTIMGLYDVHHQFHWLVDKWVVDSQWTEVAIRWAEVRY